MDVSDPAAEAVEFEYALEKEDWRHGYVHRWYLVRTLPQRI